MITLNACSGIVSAGSFTNTPPAISSPTISATRLSTSPVSKYSESGPATPAVTTNTSQSTPQQKTEQIINSTQPPSPGIPQAPATQIPADYWKSLPIIPTVSQTSLNIYLRGQEMGRNPHSFSKIGDCQSITTYFLSYFELPDFYDLGDYTSLQDTINWFEGSFSRESLAVKGGFNAAAVLSPLRSDLTQCEANENPIACEFRLHNPSIALISLEEWWSGHPENYEKYMRQIIEYSIQQGVIPIVATKADNLEGNHLINQTIAKLALEYDIPLWNFWLAVQPLKNHGLIAKDTSGNADMFHLTHGNNFYFSANPKAKQSGWSVRNLTALQTLDAVRQGLSNTP